MAVIIYFIKIVLETIIKSIVVYLMNKMLDYINKKKLSKLKQRLSKLLDNRK